MALINLKLIQANYLTVILSSCLVRKISSHQISCLEINVDFLLQFITDTQFGPNQKLIFWHGSYGWGLTLRRCIWVSE